ncbi:MULTISPECIES: glycosyl transferase [Mameliella]|jgi:glucosyl-3-phosphoglycerate synthase|uniref:Glycosyltransferase n=1 Tax=Mameliella alba TaxID=561184 RepID=A0A0B3RTV3_9RHOB|nr:MULTISPECIES: glycosyl transferase [Mameliella]ODM50466.1 glycosyl transferase [Ruegeria sp. PBVC088]KHQ51467.1 Glycosyltransferase [Mameliella alba]MBY6118154.1 glycosyl transferase [Mameliella alba]MDD9728614.1 glycosyl transferase [Mameliella sp. AT18]OWV42299.1 glycosyl transferase [Mameliella alba]
MSDFHQNGNIAQFHNLRSRPLEELIYEIETYAQTRKITLVLPCLYSELEGPAMGNILDELSKVTYLHRIIIGLDRATEQQFRRARDFFSRLPQDHVVLWNDSPRMSELDAKLAEMGLAPQEQGKGKNMWTCMGYLISCADTSVMALHDCDIVTYKRDLLDRLVYPVVNPNFRYQLSKGYYPRIGDGKLNGRVTRLLVSPLLIALKRTIGDRDYIDYLRAFRYPLSGEFALRTSLLPDLRIPSDWGLEIGVLSEVWRNLGRHSVCQVEIADAYDHKHQQVSEEDAATGLNRMSMDICKAVFRKLAADGTVFTPNVFRALKATYYRVALDLIEFYDNDAKMNGLTIDRHREELTVELFANNIVEAGKVFLEKPNETPFVPNWSRVNAADPGIVGELRAAVAADNEEFAPMTF